MRNKIQLLLTQLNHGLVERESTLKAALLTVLSGENLVLVGPPGTGKSLVARRIAESLSHAEETPAYFEYLLTKFSTPEEIFGPLSIAELKADRLKRNTAGYLPTVRLAFLDEIFKASSSILNALLTILNERMYHNGAEPQHVPLQSLIAASNELPSDQEELSALYDRFLVRVFVGYVSPNNLGQLFERPGKMPAMAKLTVADLQAVTETAESVMIPPEIVEAIQRIWVEFKECFKEDRRENLSDRRLKKIIKLICVSAATNSRQDVDLSDVFLLKDCLWNHPDNALKVRDLVLNVLRSYSRQVAQIGSEMPAIQSAAAELSASAALSNKATGGLHAVVKGYKGSGTVSDPILIENVHDLVGLERPEVGLQGYHFRQIADIDCSGLTTWPEIIFKGLYDGSGYLVKYKRKEFRSLVERMAFRKGQASDMDCLFLRIEPNSTVVALSLDELALAGAMDNCRIETCKTNAFLVAGDADFCHITACESANEIIVSAATNCTLLSCKAQGYLIGKVARDSTVSECFSATGIIGGEAHHCQISDCLVMADRAMDIWEWNDHAAGIALRLCAGSLVERCYIGGEIGDSRGGPASRVECGFSGIASVCESSTIRCCALGELKLAKTIGLVTRISIPSGENWVLENNVSIDSNSSVPEALASGFIGATVFPVAFLISQKTGVSQAVADAGLCDAQGKTVAALLFNQQRYFEHTLGWNFEQVWQWSDADNRPALRSVGVNAVLKPSRVNIEEEGMVDLLTQQIRTNIWL